MAKKFTIVVDEADDGFTITIPEMPELVTCGATLEEALTNAQAAVRAWEDLKKEGLIP